MKNTGYSGTPLAKKLGIKDNFTIKLVNEPAHYFDLFMDFPANITATRDKKGKKDFIHYFATDAKKFENDLVALKSEMEQSGALWVSWNKKSSKIVTEISENLIRKTALKIGLVDVKVCSVDELWSGLKLVIPVKDRK